ncbi:MAG: glutamate-5-semialdehyde dehydrogenase [Clostridia bacterium]|nr:glutamate-5-semialdehyde dehydrogenase [Clostridia bacterium]
MESLEQTGMRAKKASRYLAKLGIDEKNKALDAVADALEANAEYIIRANEKDLENARANGMKPALIDRIALNEKRIKAMADGIRVLTGLEDPVGEVTGMKKRPNGLVIGTKRVPLGVVAIIYESRPNVTADAFGLTFKSGNACILRGGSDSINSNIAIEEVISNALKDCGIDSDVINLVRDTDRALVNELMHMNDYVDVIIPRGGAGLIKNVVMNSTVPVIETGTGNCHVYVDEYADIQMAVDIIYNAKTSRIGVCNACESLVVHKAVAKQAVPAIVDALKQKDVEVRGDEYACQCDDRIVKASEEDWGKEYLDYIISLKTVDSIDEAIEHINRYNTGHSESIITKDYNNANRFLDEIDAACVYVNASTRFSDGYEFGFGAEIGISTQKLHARGPMGLKALTTTKYVIYGEGQVRQ